MLYQAAILILHFRPVIRTTYYYFLPILVAARSKTWVCDRSLDGIVGSNPAGGMDVCLLSVVCCQIEVSASS